MEFIFTLWRPVLEILFIWMLVYYIIQLFQGTRAIQVLGGLAVLAIVFNIAKFLELNTINWVLTKLFAVGVFAFLIIFQPELRRALARIGQNRFKGAFLQQGGAIDALVDACDYFSKKKIGAIIALERDVSLRGYIESGIQLDSKVSAELLISIFAPNTPTHDGGCIIKNGRLASCGSLFPLSQNTGLARELGTRHRAAIGLTEDTDAVCVLVSEESGAISVSVYGKLTRWLDPGKLESVLRSLFKSTQKKESWKDSLFKWTFLGEKSV